MPVSSKPKAEATPAEPVRFGACRFHNYIANGDARVPVCNHPDVIAAGSAWKSNPPCATCTKGLAYDDLRMLTPNEQPRML